MRSVKYVALEVYSIVAEAITHKIRVVKRTPIVIKSRWSLRVRVWQRAVDDLRLNKVKEVDKDEVNSRDADSDDILDAP